MAKEASSLSVEQIAKLLKLEVSNLKRHGRKQIYTTSIGCLYISCSKNYGLSYANWWYSINPEIVKKEKIDYLVLAADYIGVFLIPTNQFLQYGVNNPVGKVKGDRENVTIVKEGNQFIRRESKCRDWNITEYFIKNDKIV